MKRYELGVKKEAILLRKRGYSLGQITKQLAVPKSTLHVWIRGNKRPAKFSLLDRKRWVQKIQPMGALANKRKHEKMVESIDLEVKRELENIILNKQVRKIILCALYWAEGNKTGSTVQFVNVDPRLTLLFVTLLRECFEIDESKLRVRLHLHEYHNESLVKKFWSDLLKIPQSQFQKTYRKTRSKEKTFRKNFGGICFIRYNSVILKERILSFAFTLGEKITGVVNVPVA